MYFVGHVVLPTIFFIVGMMIWLHLIAEACDKWEPAA